MSKLNRNRNWHISIVYEYIKYIFISLARDQGFKVEIIHDRHHLHSNKHCHHRYNVHFMNTQTTCVLKHWFRPYLSSHCRRYASNTSRFPIANPSRLLYHLDTYYYHTSWDGMCAWSTVSAIRLLLRTCGTASCLQEWYYSHSFTISLHHPVEGNILFEDCV